MEILGVTVCSTSILVSNKCRLEPQLQSSVIAHIIFWSVVLSYNSNCDCHSNTDISKSKHTASQSNKLRWSSHRSFQCYVILCDGRLLSLESSSSYTFDIHLPLRFAYYTCQENFVNEREEFVNGLARAWTTIIFIIINSKVLYGILARGKIIGLVMIWTIQKKRHV